MDLLNIRGNIGSAIQEAPHNFFIGIAKAIAFVPDRAKGVIIFGENIWNGMTPEQQATVESAIRKAIIAAAEAYVSGKTTF